MADADNSNDARASSTAVRGDGQVPFLSAPWSGRMSGGSQFDAPYNFSPSSVWVRTVSEPFDPYYLWLGIPPKDQPPNHYRLLAVELFENNRDVIAAAADQRIVHLRTYQLSKHVDWSQRLLNEVAAARVCLLTPEKKAAYDVRLRETLSQQPLTEDCEQRFSQELTELIAAAQVTKVGRSTREGDSGKPLPPAPLMVGTRPLQSSAKSWPILTLYLAAAVGLVLIAFVWIMLRGSHQTPRMEVAASRTQAREESGKLDSGASARRETKITGAGSANGSIAKPVEVGPNSSPPTTPQTASPTPGKAAAKPELVAQPMPEAEPKAPNRPAPQPATPGEPPPNDATRPVLAAKAEAASAAVFGSTPPFAVAPFDAETAKQHQIRWARYLGVPVEMRNSISMRLVLIPPGEFMMGSSEENKDAADHERPEHRVRISRSFYLGVFEVTQAEYQQVMGNNPSTFAATGRESAKVAGKDTSSHPVEAVSWMDAGQFCSGLSAMPNERAARQSYRLPTEAEWEYACRAGTATNWHSGDRRDTLDEYGWSRSNSQSVTHTVGQRKPNAWGLHDIHGNVWEWCWDCYESGYYALSPTIDPSGPTTGPNRVVRGGSWLGPPAVSRSARRDHFSPGFRDARLGFRVALSVDSALADKGRMGLLSVDSPLKPNNPKTLSAEMPKSAQAVSPAKRDRSQGLTNTRKPRNGNWLVVFRSGDPRIWGHDVSLGPNMFAVSLASAPQTIKFVKMQIQGQQPVVIEMTKARLDQEFDDEKIGWNGKNQLAWQGRHLGIYDRMTKVEKGTVKISGVFSGWGFGDKHGGPAGQAYCWGGKPIQPTIFEIAVKSGDLSADEEPWLLGTSKEK